MVEPTAIFSIIGTSVGLIVTLAGRSGGVPRSRQHIKQVHIQKKNLRHKLNKAEEEIHSLNGISTKGVRDLRCETKNLISYSRYQIRKFERFRNRFNGSWIIRVRHYIIISTGRDDIQKYAKRFEVYSDWITIARLCISLTHISERASPGDADVSASSWSDINRLRDELDRVRRAKETYPTSVRKVSLL
ncbi:hypothetical protein F4679DRAFT_274766 [Xylaria curta]|nr:hypothetical protein F4679DRAFT_274766 [Xylaria curta]